MFEDGKFDVSDEMGVPVAERTYAQARPLATATIEVQNTLHLGKRMAKHRGFNGR